jgi:hypothetical protein
MCDYLLIYNTDCSNKMSIIGSSEADRLFPRANRFDRIIAAYCCPKPIYGGLIGTIIAKMIKLKRDDSNIRNMLEQYRYEETYEPDITVTVTVILTLFLADSRLELVDYAYRALKKCKGKYPERDLRVAIEPSYLDQRNIMDNIIVIEFLHRRSMLSRYGYWGDITEKNDTILYFILKKKDYKLAKWATGKMIDKTKNGFGHGVHFNLEDLRFIRMYSELFDQRNVIMKNAYRMAIQNQDIDTIRYLIRNSI